MSTLQQVVISIDDTGKMSVAGNFRGDVVGLLERAKLALMMQENSPAIEKPNTKQVMELAK
jgi:hypothetical protein